MAAMLDLTAIPPIKFVNLSKEQLLFFSKSHYNGVIVRFFQLLY